MCMGYVQGNRFVFAGIALGFTLVSIFSEDACMQVAATIEM